MPGTIQHFADVLEKVAGVPVNISLTPQNRKKSGFLRRPPAQSASGNTFLGGTGTRIGAGNLAASRNRAGTGTSTAAMVTRTDPASGNPIRVPATAPAKDPVSGVTRGVGTLPTGQEVGNRNLYSTGTTTPTTLSAMPNPNRQLTAGQRIGTGVTLPMNAQIRQERTARQAALTEASRSRLTGGM